MNGKIAVIGAGYVGASIAYAVTLKGLADKIVLIEQPEAAEKCKAETLDIQHGLSHMGLTKISCGDYSEIKDCGLIIVTAGRNRRHGESRFDMITDNCRIAESVAAEIKKYYNGGVVLVVTNPVDIITKIIIERLDLPQGKVFGSGCVLDSSRLVSVVANHFGLRSDAVDAHVIGIHGEGQVAMWSRAAIDRTPIAQYCEAKGLHFTSAVKAELEQKVRTMGMEIIERKGRTHFGIATCVCYIAGAILNRLPVVASVSSILQGEYGIRDVALSLPSVINADGVVRRLEDRPDDGELSRLLDAAEVLRGFADK